MNWLNQVNPARRLVGRLFLWFWVTFIATAAITFYAVRFFSEAVSIETPSEQELNVMQRTVKNILRAQRTETQPMRKLLSRADRGGRHMVIAVDLTTGQVIRDGGPPMPLLERQGFLQLAYEDEPITLKRGGFRAVGPAKITTSNKEYAVFVGLPGGPPNTQRPIIYFLTTALVVTVLLSYLFARSLVKPIDQLQQASKKLALGDWQTRVEKPAMRKDELGHLARDFNSMAAQLEKLWQGQQRLLADISHELRSPLARLQMAVGLAHQKGVDPQSLRRIEREAERMENLISQLLQLTRAGASKPEIHRIPINVLMDGIVSDARFEAANLKKQLVVSPMPDDDVPVNATLIGRAVENVLRNALRHANETVELSVYADDQRWWAAIDDDGPGLSEEECEAVFAPFYRASLARERESGGVGLGLAIAKAAVDMHHGHIVASRSERGGLRVEIALPRNI
ncbi:ATP-binding protein [Aestuariibacter sp. A3R04]|uniref:ATP-binding protein n=1 Tax=Aestuariibacter sp. A3R04 TaxID=2841571 RepID=UPI001C091D79|nr:ATP-binding protein [Aestuariibacter sp. A3R04]MBU3020818.1 HAMP domain-containing protein [Aestuariibacter sp. A3R04]